MNKTLKIGLSIAVIFVCLCVIAHAAVIYLKKFTFDEDDSLDKWKSMILNGKVDYTLMKYGDEGYVQAQSEKTCSALYYRVGFDLEEYPLLRWKWRVLQFPDISKATTDEERDDYAARVYVIFPFLNFSSSKFLEYVWAEDIPVGTIMDSPFGDNMKIMIVRSGRIEEAEWVSEKRDVYKDYLKAFGETPQRTAGAIAIMCDSDGTETSAESLFDDITIEKEKGL